MFYPIYSRILLCAIEEKHRFTKRRIGMIGMALTLLFAVPIVAFTPITGANVLTVTEPLKLVSATASSGTCTLGLPGTTSFTFSCVSTVFAGETGTITIAIMNQGSVPVVVKLASTSNNTDVVVVNPVDTTLPQAQTTSVIYTYTISQSAIPDSVTLNFMVTR